MLKVKKFILKNPLNLFKKFFHPKTSHHHEYLKKKNHEKFPIILSMVKKIKILKIFLTMLPLFRVSRKNIYQKGFHSLQNMKKIETPKEG
jgi:hypothetical protein